ncbi:MAG TPA: hypothetical protein VEG43_03280 [Dehalococcoidia bacterium]|nr:hypothetical protein [Dehalococcoidia bacterium]
MPRQEQVMETLDKISVPGIMHSLVKMKLVRDVKIANHKVDVILLDDEHAFILPRVTAQIFGKQGI